MARAGSGTGSVECGKRPGAACHVKEATVAFRRMGDMGKLPTSAWFNVWEPGLAALIQRVCAADAQPTRRAQLLVQTSASVRRVGEKLATLFVGALSTPSLARDSSPLWPQIDGNELVVIDTNVAAAIDVLEPKLETATYGARATWVREQAATVDLRSLREGVPAYSPRLVQQALYSFCSRSNRSARSDTCATSKDPCAECAPATCPFGRRNEGAHGTQSTSRRRPDRLQQ